ncbi:LysR substrate-binding domain-containing protein [Shewanella aquimarina]|uniref:LysR substrate-binding domain-containing protein n=1 Tax=Shewanella aquimarina TaxID=260365 RepID=UPI002014D26D|nr:LysR substrate-binding domain-containing protein [Shewanella aquimarina]MCL2908734.1 LysR substrate-binding domain-containing protein [Shewanella aquimarina]
MNNNIPLRALQIFEACARLESCSLAANELCITQSAVSQQIKQLEDYFLEKLFYRQSGKINLTEAGIELRERLAPVFYDLNSVCSSLVQNMTGEVRVHSYTSLAARWLVPKMEQLRQIYPELNINVGMFQNDIEMSDMIADIFIVTREFQDGYTIIPLVTEKLVAFCSPQYYAQSNGISVDTLDQHCLLYSKHKDYGVDWDTWFRNNELAISPNQRKIIFNHNMLAVQAAIYGQGIVLGLEQTLKVELDSGNLVKLDLPTCLSGLTYYIAYKTSKKRDARIMRIVDWIIDNYPGDHPGERILAR